MHLSHGDRKSKLVTSGHQNGTREPRAQRMARREPLDETRRPRRESRIALRRSWRLSRRRGATGLA